MEGEIASGSRGLPAGGQPTFLLVAGFNTPYPSSGELRGGEGPGGVLQELEAESEAKGGKVRNRLPPDWLGLTSPH